MTLKKNIYPNVQQQQKKMCTHENNVPSCLLSKWPGGNSCTWEDDVRLPIAGTNEPTMTTLYIRAFQIVLRGGRWVSPRWRQANHIFCEKGQFFNRAVGT